MGTIHGNLRRYPSDVGNEGFICTEKRNHRENLWDSKGESWFSIYTDVRKSPDGNEGRAYLSKLNTVFVTTPIGADIIKMPGGGQNYVHGGSSLQEMVVPVIKVNTFKGKQDTGLVNVELSSFHHRVTNIEVKLDFMQMEAVADTVKPRRLQAFFVDADGAKISFPVPITANIKSADAKDRLIQEKFTLKSGRYSRDQEYFLVIADQDDEKKELHRYKFEIDISDMAY